MTPDQIKTAAHHLCVAACWADCPDDGKPWQRWRVPAATLKTAAEFVTAFVTAYPAETTAALARNGYGAHPDAGSPEASFGQDLFLTCRGAGVGFWDRKELGEAGEKLGEIIRIEWRRWYIETDFRRGWVYFSCPNFAKSINGRG